jgi:putative transcriptional regulator
MTDDRSELGLEVEQALNEVLGHVRGEIALPTRLIDTPTSADILAVRKKLGLSRRRFAERFRLDPRTLQDWEQGRRTPDQAARVLLTVIEREPEAVDRALTP